MPDDTLADALSLVVEGLRYTLDRQPPKGGKKAVVTVSLADGNDGPPLVDTANLYSHRARLALAATICDTFGRQTGQIMGHLAVLLDQVERAAATEDGPHKLVLTDKRKRAAKRLLARPTLLDDAAAALETLGYVGEETAKRLVYLIATSRLLDKPLSATLVAPLASGKSDLLGKLTRLFPPESVEFLSRITPAALYYAGPDHLCHKVVVVDEQAGAADADYAIRTLQTKGFLRLALPIKGKTVSFEARGPIALLSGTTRTDLNPENLSRCMELSLDDSPEQTRRIQNAQRRAWANAGAKKTFDTEVWQDAQRVLEPFAVVIPYAEQLAYPARTTRDRREQQKLLSLIAAHALLFQRQRKTNRQGRLLATVSDYRAIYDLVRGSVAAELDGLSTRAAHLYRELSKREDPSITRREAAALLATSYNTGKAVVEELLANELVRLVGARRPRRYQIADASLLGHGVALTAPEALRPTPSRRSRVAKPRR